MDTMRICEFSGYDTTDPRQYDHKAEAVCQESGECQVEHEDVVVNPSHYSRWAIQPSAYTMRNNFEFWRGNIIKYASRAGYKLYENMTKTESEITDLKKVIRYAEMRVNLLKGEVEL
jgi:hypothetical protein